MPTRLSRYCEGVIEAAWLAAVILIPVFFNIYSSRIFEPDKIAILRSLALVILGAWIVKIVDTGQGSFPHSQTGEGTLKSIFRIPLVIPVAAMGTVYILSTLFSVTQRVSLWGSYQRLQGTYTTLSYLVIFAAILGNLRRRAQAERLFSAIIISSLPVSLYGFLQRYKIDPIPWGGDVSRRIAANMGNSIFVAAYLIMVFPLTVGRVLDAFRSIWRESGQLAAQIARATVYLFIAVIQVIAIYMSGSRGPMLGLLLGSLILLLLLSWQWAKRWLTSAIVGLAVVGILFFGVFNIPNGPLEGLRQSPAIGRFGLLLDAESNSALVRRYIWEGTVKLVSPHKPLQFPDGRVDSFNAIRLLIGYGPESMYVAFNPFYVPELGQVERRNASPDRAHNETWDSLVITGLFGFSTYLGIFILVFYFGLSWIGLINHRFQRILFFLLIAIGSTGGAIILSLWRGVEYLALGLPVGLITGLVLYVVYAVFANPSPVFRTAGETARAMTMILLLVAVISHFLEINFGIAIAVTRLYFWVYSALLILAGLLLPKYGEYDIETVTGKSQVEAGLQAKDIQTASISGNDPKSTRLKRARKGERQREYTPRGSSPRNPGWLSASIPEAGIAALTMVALGYNFISNSSRLTSITGIFLSSLTRLPNQNNAVSLGIFSLVITTWLLGVVLLAAEKTKDSKENDLLKAFWPILVLSGAIALLYSVWHAGTLAALIRIVPETVDQLKLQVARVGSLLTNFYFYFFLLVFGLGYFLAADWPASKRQSSFTGALVGAILVIASLWIIYTTNLRVIHADIVFKMAEPYNKAGQWPVATELYKETNQLAPDQDHYYLFLGRSYLEQAKAETDSLRQDNLVREAEQDLKVAQGKNPLNTDHTANLGRLYSWWASKATDEQTRQARGEIASNYYAMATTLSPQNSTLWGEWAILSMDVLNQPDIALRNLERALALDTRYNWTQGLMGDYYARIGRTITDTEKKEQAFNQALVYYKQAFELSKSTENSAKIGYLVSQGNVYAELGKYLEAVTAYEGAVALAPSANDLWRIEETIARTYLLAGDKQNALLHAKAALQAAPEDQAARINQLIDQINGSSN